MERLYEAGKRVERLIYTSVFVIISSFAFYSLSVSILQDSNKINLESYQSLVEELTLDYPYYKEAENLRGAIRAYISRKNKEDFTKTKPSLEFEDFKIQEENDSRATLGLPVFSSTEMLRMNNNHATLEVENKNNIKRVNLIRKKFGLPERNSERLALKTYDEMKGKLIERFSFADQSASLEFSKLILNSGDFDSLLTNLKSKLIDISQKRIKILNIDTPLQFPFSLGEVKSNISLYNVARMGMTVYPIFLVFWVGSFCMTRSRELSFLIQSGKVMASYPHVLNLFAILTSDFKQKRKGKNKQALFILGDKRTILLKTSLAISMFGIRVFIGLGLLVVIIFPAYWGFANLYSSNAIKIDIIQKLTIPLCCIVNIFQLLIYVFNEYKISDAVFITNGDSND
ncbi:hypothetical protein D9O29_22905 [Pantoea vagans]|uniref:Uncharacterized protein n=1 Tax=Pantoea vagans TaxID=470934 RepID=A0ABY3LA55_9GAMM|nr:hypothetical protein D9O29_22905 [Pantoea vagans]